MDRTKKILIFASLLRFLLLPFLYHPDLKSQYFQAQFLSKGYLNIYTFLSQNSANLPYRDTFNYTPPIYLIQGGWYYIVSHLAPGNISQWINDWSQNQYGYSNLPWFLLLLKLPYFLADMLLGYFILKRFGRKAGILWLFNPFPIYAIYFHSNFDILPAALAFIGLTLIEKKKNPIFSALCISTAVSLKIFPIFILPIVWIQSANVQKKFYFYTTVFIFLYLIIFQLYFPGWWQSLSSSGLLQKAYETKVLVFPIFPLVYLSSLFFLLFNKIKPWFFILLLSTSFWIFVPMHGQWLVWFLPLLITQEEIYNSKLNMVVISLVLSVAVFKIFSLNDLFMTFGHFVPINQLFQFQTIPYDYLSNHLPLKMVNGFSSLIQAFSFILLIGKYVHKNIT